MQELILNRDEFIKINAGEELSLLDETYKRTLLVSTDFEIFSDLAIDRMMKVFHTTFFKEFDFLIIDSEDKLYGKKGDVKSYLCKREDAFEYYSKMFPLNVQQSG